MTTPTPTPEDLDRIVRWLRAGSADDPDYTIATNDDAADAITALRAQVAEARKRADRVVAAFVCTGRGITVLVDSAHELRAAIAALGGDHAE